MGRQPESKTSKRRLRSREREHQALELRKLGLPYRVIAERLEMATASGAYRLVMKALARLEDETKERASELRRLETERLDQLLISVVAKASQGHLGAVDRVLRIMERRSKLWGLDAPKRIHASGPDDGAISVEHGTAIAKLTDEQLVAEVESKS